MTFASIDFVVFISITLTLFFILRLSRGSNRYYLFFILLSLYFYGYKTPQYIGLILGSTIVDYVAALSIQRSTNPQHRKLWLTSSIVVNLGVLAVFKYLDFGIQSVVELLSIFELTIPNYQLNLLLPVGISFYTFQSMSYTIDVYRENISAKKNFLQVLFFTTFFPQLVAGPIVRATEFFAQIDKKRTVNYKVISEGLYLIIYGFFLKMVLADNLAKFVDTYWNALAAEVHDTRYSLLVIVGFSAQIFCDFSGYSKIARGLGLLFGFRLPENFRAPYIAVSFSEFWTRWHISLSTWLRDYLYISLGGNRKGRYFTYVNLFIVMVLGGLWHGAAYTYIIWGVLHGLFLMFERAIGLNRPGSGVSIKTGVQFCITQLGVLIAWVFFRSESATQAYQILRNSLTWSVQPYNQYEFWFVVALLSCVVILHVTGWRVKRLSRPPLSSIEKAVYAGIMLPLVWLTVGNTASDFIYFQF